MSDATAAPERFDIGRVFSGGFAIVARRPLTLIVLTLLFGYLPAAATFWLTTQLAPQPGQLAGPAALGPMLQRVGVVELIAVAIGGFGWVLQGAAAAAALSDYGERPLGLGEALARAGPRLPVVYVLGVLSTLAVVLGTFALVVPGILLALAWAVGGVVATVENTGFKSFGRSAELTRGCRVQLLVILLTWGVVGFVASLVARLVGGAALMATGGADPLWVTLGLQPLAGAAVQIFSTATVIAAYVELRGAKEGVAASSLAALFD